MDKFAQTVAILAASIFLVDANAQDNREWGVDRSIVQVSDSVYRWGSDNQYGAYIVGTEAIAVVDGHYCPSGTMQWLKAEIERRHTVPVKYVILSHDHPDHVCNSQVFADTATAIGHTNIVEHMIRESRPSMIPEITFDESMDLRLGGVTVKLMYLGPSHSDNLIQVHVPEEKVMVAVDLAKGKSLFPDYRDMDVHSTLRILKRLSYMGDIETVLPGHGPVTDQQNFRDQYDYLQALRDEVLEHIVAGRSLAEIRDLVTLEEFSDYVGYDRWLDQNVVTMWGYLYRYREPNQRITEDEAVLCREDVTQCRTADP
jgi:glyoxylase-like metal-dependent hydrolase (beta-lactamase superfamily II)